MRSPHRHLGAILLLALTALASAYSPICPGENINWMMGLPLAGPIRNAHLQKANLDDFLNATPEQHERLPTYGYANFNEHGALTTLRNINGDTHTFTNANALRAATRTTKADGTQESNQITYRHFDDEGRPTEYAITTITPHIQTRTVYKINHYHPTYHRIEATTYLRDGTIAKRETDTLHNCLKYGRTGTYDTGGAEAFYIYWNGPDRINIQTGPRPEFDGMRETVYARLKGSNKPRSELPHRTYETSVVHQDEHGNPTLFIYTELVKNFDEWVPQNARVHRITYDYYGSPLEDSQE